MSMFAFPRTLAILAPALSLGAPASRAMADGSVGSKDFEIAAHEATTGGYFTSSQINGQSKTAGGAGIRGQICLLCFVLHNDSYPHFRVGDLLALEVAVGYQSPPGGSLGSAWALFRADFGVQGFVAVNPDIELGLRYYYLDEGDFARDEDEPFKNKDHVWVIEPAFRYDRTVVEVGIKASGERGSASYVTLGARYLSGGDYFAPMKSFIGVNFERYGIDGAVDSTGGHETGTSYTVRFSLGIQN